MLEKLQGLLEKNCFNKKPLQEEGTTGTGTQTEVPAQKLENQVRDTQPKLKNVIRIDIQLKLKIVIQISINTVDSFQAGNIK